MNDSLFYSDVEKDSSISKLVSNFREYSEANSVQIYIIKKALGNENKFEYSYSQAAVFLIPKHRIVILNYGKSDDEFLEFNQDFLEDLGILSDKYEYKKILGRPREWSNLLITRDFDGEVDISRFLHDTAVEKKDERKVDLLISLLIGSINDVDKIIGIDTPDSLLAKVKQKIVLFDGMQSRFVYENVPKKTITIQGLAGTGKTELLLHKLQKIYLSNKNSKLAFTCFNKVLADDMRNRIPRFFNFMKVEEQIEWNERLWVFPSWGSESDPNSGLYSFICKHYKIDFKRYSYINSFETVCSDALQQLRSIGKVEPCFDYIFIDESQDFTTSFFDLCQMIAREKVYIAGDIFQNIFDTNFENTVNCDYLLNKCYRTDPKTLMFAHSVGMGLYEQPVIRWLEDKEWEACGYNYERKDKFLLRRSPIRRFEDITDNSNSVKLIQSSFDQIEENIINCIGDIKESNPTVAPDDIAIIFLSNQKSSYAFADSLVFSIEKKFGWRSYQGYVTKSKLKDKLFISNINNIKGLEFPFIICVETGFISDHIIQRNSIYMVLTRSFLTSYFIVNEVNKEFITTYSRAYDQISKDNYMALREPSQKEKEAQAEKIKIAASRKRSVEDIINEICKDYPQLKKKHMNMLYSSIPTVIENETEDEIVSKTVKMINVILGD